MITAFGREWANEEEIRTICASVSEMSDGSGWKSFRLLVGVLIALQKDKYLTMTDIGAVRQNTGIIEGMKKLLAIPDECEQILNKGNK